MTSLKNAKSGRLLVVKDSGKRASNREIYWTCLCECGNTVDVLNRNLVNNRTKSCGCLQKEKASKDITGLRFGRLIANTKLNRKASNGNYYWLCQCDCGNTKEVKGSDLNSGTVRSCGCLARETARKLMTKHGLSDTAEYKAAHSKKHKELKRKLDSNWTPEMEKELKEFSPFCAICGMSQEDHKTIYNESLHVDHVYPKSLGYGLTPGNAVLLCRPHNIGKWNRLLDTIDPIYKDKIIVAAESFKKHWDIISAR